MIRIISLCDNIIDNKKCWAAEGASFLIQADGKNILFDTGRFAEVLLHNLEVLDLPVETIDRVVLSHGHQGHIGSMTALLSQLNKEASVLFGAGIDDRKRKEGSPKNNVSFNNSQLIEKIKNRGRYQVVQNNTWITKNCLVLANIPVADGSLTAFREKYKVMKSGIEQVDRFEEELALCIVSDRGYIVVSGCAHRGIDNIVSCAGKALPDKQLYGIVGGLHTKNDMEKTERLKTYISTLGLELLAPCHCTGIYTKALLRDAFPTLFREFTTGSMIEV